MLPRTGTMRSSKLPGGALLCALLLLSAAGAQLLDEESEEELSPRALRDFYPKGPNLTSEKQLVSLGCAPQTRKSTNKLSFAQMFSSPLRVITETLLLLTARSSPGSFGEAAGQTAAVLGEEVWSSSDGNAQKRTHALRC